MVDYHLHRLVELGMIRREPGISRGIEVLTRGAGPDPYDALMAAANRVVDDPDNCGESIAVLAAAIARVRAYERGSP